MFSSISENVMYGRSEGYTSYILSKQLYEKIYGFQDINKVISVPVHHDDPWLIDRLELIDEGEKPSYYPTPTTNEESETPIQESETQKTPQESKIKKTPQESKIKKTPLIDYVLKNSGEIRKINAKKIAKITKPYAFFEKHYMTEENFGKHMISKSAPNIFKKFHREITKNLPYDENFSKYLLFCLFDTKLFDMGAPIINNFLAEFRRNSIRDNYKWLGDLNTDYLYFKQQY